MKRESKVFIIYILLLFQSTFANISHPVTPKFVTGLGIDDYMFGVFFASMSFGLMIGGFLWGHLGDLKNKKYIIVTGILIYAAGQVLFGYSSNPFVMVLFRILSGFGTSAAITLFTAQVIESSSKDQRTRNLGYSVAFMTMGTSIGYYLGGQLGSNPALVNIFSTNDCSRVFLIQGILNVFLAVAVMFLFNFEHNKLEKNKTSIFTSLKYIGSLKPTLFIFLISLALFSMGRINVEKYLDVYFNELGYLTADIGTFVMITGFVSLFTSFLIVPLFKKTKKLLSVILIMHVASALIIFYVFNSSDFMFNIYSFYMVFIVLRTIYQPLEQTYISEQVTDGKYSLAMGVRQSFFSLGMIIGPLLGGFLYQIKPNFLFNSSVAMFLLSSILLVCILYVLRKEKIDIEL